MATTSAGTPYTVRTNTLDDGTEVYWGVADSHYGDTDLPTVLYGHGAAGAANQFATLSAWTDLRNWVIDNGWAWVESSGGGSQPWGNQASQDAYLAAVAYADTQMSVGPIVALGRSMSGAVITRIYLDSAISSRCVGLIVCSGVQDLVWAYDYDSERWTAAFNSAWNVTSKAEFETAASGMNPLDMDIGLWTGKNVLQLTGTADTTVVPEANGLAMRALYAGLPAIDLLTVRQGGDHSSANGTYHEVTAMTDFMTQVTGGTPPPPVTPNVYQVIAEYLIGADGTTYAVEQRTYA